VAGVLSVKADTNDLAVSLADARRMEQRAREAALTVRAQQEASAKVAQAPAHAAAERLREAAARGEALPRGAAPKSADVREASTQSIHAPIDPATLDRAAEPKAQPVAEFHIHNQALLDSARDSAPIRTARLAQCKELDEQLHQHPDLTQEGKLRVAECLNSPDSAKMLERFKDPREAIAVAGVRSGAMNLKDAVKDLPANQQMAVKIYVRNDEIEKERSQERSREQSHENYHGLDFSL
jgi:hypothetical protein